jgi:hypothetical protein
VRHRFVTHCLLGEVERNIEASFKTQPVVAAKLKEVIK